LSEKEYMQNTADVGEYALDTLEEIKARHPSMETCGIGLMIGVEFVKDKRNEGA
jgi:4-aminobutyrate aminotransferase-like enzyme